MTQQDSSRETTEPTSQLNNEQAAQILGECFEELLSVEENGGERMHRVRTLALVLCQHPPAVIAEIADFSLRWSYAAKTALRLAALLYAEPPCLDTLDGLKYRELVESETLARAWIRMGRKPRGREGRLVAVRDLFGLWGHLAESGLRARGANPDAHLIAMWPADPEDWQAVDRAALEFARHHDPLSIDWSSVE